MSSKRAPDSESSKSPSQPRSSEKGADSLAPDPLGQSPDDPIEFTSNTDVARGNAERANAEPEPPALHDAEVPGKSDAWQRHHHASKTHDH